MPNTFTSAADSFRSGWPSEWSNTNSTYSGCDMVASVTIPTEKGTLFHVLGTITTLTYSVNQELAPVRNVGNINARDYVEGPRTIAGSLVFTTFDRHWTDSIQKKLNSLGIYDTDYWIADELPPFDVTISFANEYGFISRLAIYGIRIKTEGQVMSMSDIYTENTYQYYALDIDYMKNVYDPSGGPDDDNRILTPVVENKPVETIPTVSSVDSDVPIQKEYIDDDFTFSTIRPESYGSFSEYKRALTETRSEYKKNAAKTDKKKEYNKTISDNFSKKLKAGIEHFKKGGA